MTPRPKQTELRHYLEQWGLLFESLGSTRMMGRVLGWLLVCEPPEQTAREIADALGVVVKSLFLIEETKLLALTDGLTDIYLGHSHLPFSDFSYAGLTFHNTGSTIRGLEWNMLKVEPGYAEADAGAA